MFRYDFRFSNFCVCIVLILLIITLLLLNACPFIYLFVLIWTRAHSREFIMCACIAMRLHFNQSNDSNKFQMEVGN